MNKINKIVFKIRKPYADCIPPQDRHPLDQAGLPVE
jgi:hypothetical protein